jgi:hypothetical protein
MERRRAAPPAAQRVVLGAGGGRSTRGSAGRVVVRAELTRSPTRQGARVGEGARRRRASRQRRGGGGGAFGQRRGGRPGTGRAVGRDRDERGLRGTRVAGGGGWVEPNLAWLC